MIVPRRQTLNACYRWLASVMATSVVVLTLQGWNHSDHLAAVSPPLLPPEPQLLLLGQAVGGTIDSSQTSQTAATAYTGADWTMPRCGVNFSRLVRRLNVNKTAPRSFQDISDQHPEVMYGGIWRPPHCTSESRLAVVIPFRDRDEHLKIFMQHIHPFLQAQLIEYQIVVVEQAGKTPFNRGLMRNIGFIEANKMADFRCAVFQDVDLLPIDQRNLYSCPSAPRHLCVAIDKYQYKPLSNGHGFDFKMVLTKGGTYVVSGGALFGGSVLFDGDHFRQVNGYSNLFFGWGGEDDDLLNRIVTRGFALDRPGPHVGVYVGLSHKQSSPNPQRWDLLDRGMERIDVDGLSSLNYTVLSHDFYPTHTHIVVSVEETAYAAQIGKEIAGSKYKKKPAVRPPVQKQPPRVVRPGQHPPPATVRGTPGILVNKNLSLPETPVRGTLDILVNKTPSPPEPPVRGTLDILVP